MPTRASWRPRSAGARSGATCNPVIALAAIRADQPRWQGRIAELAGGAADRHRVRDRLEGRRGGLAPGGHAARARLRGARRSQRPAVDADRPAPAPVPRRHLADQAEHFASLAPEHHRQDPCDVGGRRGDRGGHLPRRQHQRHRVVHGAPGRSRPARRSSAGCGVARPRARTSPSIGPVVTIMVGRLDDWLKEVVARDGIEIDPEHLEWAGVAAVKRAYTLFRERGLRARVLAAAYRNQLQWTELVGGDLVLSPPFGVAGEVPGQRHRPDAAHRRAGRPGDHRPRSSASRTSVGPTSPTA